MAKELSARAEHLLGTQDEGLAFFVHEVRNPLAVIKGYACALENLDPVTDSNQITATAAAIQRAAGTLESIISSLAAEGASVSRDIDLVEREVLISALVEETVEDLRGVSNSHTLSVSIDDDAVVLVDAVRIRQVLMNLISNAVKFSPPRTNVDIIVGRRGDEIQVCVIDEGPGIPEDRVDELFRKFSRLGSSKNGSGLGLYISREIAVAHGGDLLLRGTPRGCRFSLLLPIYEGGR
jgi:signal transduction histidine kinase